MKSRGGTDTDQLEKYGSRWLGRNFDGVFASNRIPKNFKSIIVNLDPDYKQGSHWLAMATMPSGRILVYDSFGRRTKSILPGFGRKYEDTEYDAEQRVSEDNCGQRCLAWLFLFFECGPQIAKLV